MPVYEFECVVCGRELEVTQSIKDPAPVCNHPSALQEQDLSIQATKWAPKEMVKKISKTSFSLNGSGWARDNYKGKK